jgi:hypothetical protein
MSKRSKADSFPKVIYATINNPGTRDAHLNAGVTMEEVSDSYQSDYKDIPMLAEYHMVGKPFTVKKVYKVVKSHA